MICRQLPFSTADGFHQMAADETMLHSAVAGVASFRLYCWSEATVSLGYFQPERLRFQDSRLTSLPFVRRPSGGDTLVHHHELTYAIALPAGLPWQTRESWACRMHGIIAAASHSLGISAQAAACEDISWFDGLLCFQHITAADLRIGSAKVVGSAQRRQRGALLQHGAILLATSPHTPHLPGIEELTGKTISAAEMSQALCTEFIQQTGWNLIEDDWTHAERAHWYELVVHKYSSESWNRKR